jgi:hypothetical protein
MTLSAHLHLVPNAIKKRSQAPAISYMLFLEGGEFRESEWELLYDWQFAANQLILATSPLRLTTSNFIFQMNICGYYSYVTSNLTRGWVCTVQLLLVLASALILRSDSRGTRNHILLSQIRDSPNLEGQAPRIYIPQEQGHPVIPQALGSLFVVSYDSEGYGGGIRPSLHTRGYLIR